MNSSDFEVIAISLDEDRKEWESKVFEMGIEGWYNLSSIKKWECPVVLNYHVYASLTVFVVNRK